MTDEIKVGMKIKGWRFAEVGKHHDGSYLMYNEDMVKHEGEIGTVTSIGTSSFSLQFADDWWGYPLEGAEQYIVDEVEKEKKVKEVQKTTIKVGDKVTAIRFAEVDTYYKSKSGSHEPRFDQGMERRVGEVGTASVVNEKDGYVRITFDDGVSWYYPLEALIEDIESRSQVKTKTSQRYPTAWTAVKKNDGYIVGVRHTRQRIRDSDHYRSTTKIVKYVAECDVNGHTVIEGYAMWVVHSKDDSEIILDDIEAYRTRKIARMCKDSNQKIVKYVPIKS